MDFVEDLLKFVINKNEIKNSMQNIDSHFSNLYKSCYEASLAPKQADFEVTKLDIESILDFLHDELNTGHWSEVPITVRHAFTAATYLKVIILLRKCKVASGQDLKSALKCLDMGLLLGAPLEENCDLLNNCATKISSELQKLNVLEVLDTETKIVPKKRTLNESNVVFEKLCGKEINALDCPSVEHFRKHYYSKQIPVKLKGMQFEVATYAYFLSRLFKECMVHWPAATKWCDVNYLLQVAGERTIPVEIGSHYADENWSQKLMTLKEFVTKHYLDDNDGLGYLAQHNLFDQITELKEDIRIPEYCCLSRNYENISEPDINAWFGPKGTVSPTHYDPKDNILAQVFGEKQILLFSPVDSSFLYPHEDKLLFNTAQVDPVNPDLEKFPDFKKAVMYKCLLGPGEMLYIPEKWWHHVTALSKSFSVSFWWE